MTERAKPNRPISANEVAVVESALRRAAVVPEYQALARGLQELRVIDRCPCGCDSVTFALFDPQNQPKPIADGIGTTAAGGSVGVIVWGRPGAVTGLEIYDLGAGEDDLRLPTPDSIKPWSVGAV